MAARQHRATTNEVIEALLAGPYLRAFVQLLEGERTGRKRHHPAWVPILYGAICRHYRSANHADAELRDGVWERIRKQAQHHGYPDPGAKPPTYHHYRFWRTSVIDDAEKLADLAEVFIETALQQAHEAGLLLPSSGGSLTKPSLDRTIYGDGTIVRPAYAGPKPIKVTDDQTGEITWKYKDPKTKELVDKPPTRFDPDARTHHRHDGPIRGTNFVAFSVRNNRQDSRIVLGLERTPKPGQEAQTAVNLAKRIIEANGDGVQAVLYDGAFQGTHIHDLMTHCGVIVINKVSSAGKDDDGNETPKTRVLGNAEHTLGDGTTCTHTLHINDGTIEDVALAHDGELVTVATPRRKQVRRNKTKAGNYRFHLEIEIDCPKGKFTKLFSPHPTPDDPTRPEHLRMLPPGDPLFGTFYGRRNDAESFNNEYKKSLLNDRATAIGWKRQYFDLICFAALHNSLNMNQTKRVAAA